MHEKFNMLIGTGTILIAMVSLQKEWCVGDKGGGELSYSLHFLETSKMATTQYKLLGRMDAN